MEEMMDLSINGTGTIGYLPGEKNWFSYTLPSHHTQKLIQNGWRPKCKT